MAFLRYTLLRVLVFAVVAALLWIVGLRGFWLLLFAIFLSGLVSIFVLSKSRDAASASLANRVSEIKRRMADKTAAEDVWADARITATTSGVSLATCGSRPSYRSARAIDFGRPQAPTTQIGMRGR